ncbi:hypothetical protein KKB99_08660, partial [bacterium]|nr:hypothetical protein [bacterium]MBU1026062.1 hypothetical protein [bacterium]
FTVPAIPVVSDETECVIHFDNLRLAEAAGEIILTTDEKTDISKKVISFDKIKRNKEFTKKVKITSREKSAGVSVLGMKVNSPAGSVQNDSLVLRVDPSATVHISQNGEEFVVGNSLAEFKVDASWGGGIHSFTALGKEWLQSPYPDKKAMFSWYNPWRGGIKPVLKTEHDWLDHAYKDDWKLKECSEKAGDLNFKGVELSSVMVTRDELKGSEIKTRFLLSEGHRILRFVYEARNITDIAYRAKGGFEMFLDVHPEFKTRQMFEYGHEFERKEGFFAGYHKSSGWIITENEDTHECLLILLVNPSREFPFEDILWVSDQGDKYGQHAESGFTIKLKANETARFEQYMVPCSDVNEAKKLIRLTNLGK